MLANASSRNRSPLNEFDDFYLKGESQSVDFEQTVVLEKVGHGHSDGQLLDVAVDELQGYFGVLQEGVDVRRVEGDISQTDRSVDGQLKRKKVIF